MKKIIFIASVLLFCSCHSSEKEYKIRKSLDKYFKKIKFDKATRKSYNVVFTEHNEPFYINYLRVENAANCETSIEERSATILAHRKKFESGLALTPQEKEFDSIKPKDVFGKTDDSLSRIKSDPAKLYYHVTAFLLYEKDTVWKNTVWMDDRYKIVW